MKTQITLLKAWGIAGVIGLMTGTSAMAQQGFKTEEAPMMRGVTKNIKNGWTVEPVVTVGETNNAGEDVNQTRFGYKLTGILDGIGAWKKGLNVRVVVNSELADSRGYAYTLANGLSLTGARMNSIELSRITKEVKSMGLAYDKIYDRAGILVSSATQINEGTSTTLGFNRFCSGYGVNAGKYGFTRDIFFAGEETDGGQLTALDVNSKELHVVPMAGRAAFENIVPIENFGTNKVAFLIGDDRGPAPLILYIGQKGSSPMGNAPKSNFLRSNGLANGQLYVWVADGGDRDLTSFNGTGAVRSGKFVKIQHYAPANAGTPGYDAQGFADQATQEALADAKNYFRFSRPEDLARNPQDGTQVVMASTGLSSWLGGVDSWGDVYIIDFQNTSLWQNLNKPLSMIDNINATIKIIYDGEDAGGGQFAGPDFGIRSPDNLEWADNGFIYINEDRSISTFGLTSKIEASLWQLDPESGAATRILEMDRNAVPFQQTDGAPTDIGNWESSGVLDVTDLFLTRPGETLLLLDVQGHSLSSPIIGGSTNLAEGGQILFASKTLAGRKPSYHGSDDLRTFSAQAAPSLNGSLTQEVAEDKTGNEPKLDVYPNPAQGFVRLNKLSNLTIFDMSGKVVLQVKNTREINTSNFKKGTYILMNDKEELVKLVIQ